MNVEDTTIRFELDPSRLPVTDWRQFDAMTDQERHAAALADPNCPPATEDQLARAGISEMRIHVGLVNAGSRAVISSSARSSGQR